MGFNTKPWSILDDLGSGGTVSSRFAGPMLRKSSHMALISISRRWMDCSSKTYWCVLRREWMGCWGLLGVAGISIAIASGSFPKFPTKHK